MNWRPRAHRRLIQRGAWISPILAALALAAPASAQRTEFFPSIGVGSGYTDNVYFVQTGALGDEKVSDTTNSFSVALPLRRVWATRTFAAEYVGSLEKHQEVSELDNDSHNVKITYESFNGTASKFNFRTSYEHAQTQGNPTSLDPEDIIVSDRTDRNLYAAAIGGEREVGRRWRWSGTAAVSRYEYQRIDGVPTSGAGIEDRDRYHVGTGFSRVLSRATSLGLKYGYERFVLDQSGTQQDHLVGLVVQHEPSRFYSLGGEVGVFVQSTRGGGPGRDGSGVQATFGARRKLRRMDILAAAERIPSSGGVLEGTATETAAALGLRGKPLRDWTWTFSNRYAMRDPSLAGAPTIRNLSTAGSLEWFVLRHMGIAVEAGYVDQGGSDTPELNGSYVQGAVRLVWYPRGIESAQMRDAR